MTDQAESDLVDIWTFIAQNNPTAADRMIAAIQKRSRLCVEFPEMGRSREELRAGLRSFVISPYVVFYRPVADTIEVIRVLHGARDLASLFDSEG